MKKLITWIVIIIIVLIAILLLFKPKQAPTPAVTTNTPVATVNALTVSDQNPDSLSANIGSVSLTKPGFVVIHEETNGQPGAVIAASALLPAGENKNVSVLVTLTPGKKYFAMLHMDDDNGVFDARYDVPATDANNMPIMMEFMVKESAANVVPGKG